MAQNEILENKKERNRNNNVITPETLKRGNELIKPYSNVRNQKKTEFEFFLTSAPLTMLVRLSRNNLTGGPFDSKTVKNKQEQQTSTTSVLLQSGTSVPTTTNKSSDAK